jgi:hypothetical protein
MADAGRDGIREKDGEDWEAQFQHGNVYVIVIESTIVIK